MRLGALSPTRGAEEPAFGSPIRAAFAPADILCIQETKLRRSELDEELALVEGWCGSQRAQF